MKHAVGMSDETYFRIAQWSWLVLLVAINLPPVQYGLRFIMGLVSLPFVMIFQMLAR